MRMGAIIRVFVDIGAHFGECLVEVLKPTYHFDKIICIEPSSVAFDRLLRFHDTRIVLGNFGAWNEPGETILYSTGAVGASLYSDKPQIGNLSEKIELRDIKRFLDTQLSQEDQVFCKLNAEGSEYEILKRIFESSINAWKIESILLSLDMSKVPSLRTREEDFLKFLYKRNVNFSLRRKSDPAEAIQDWLESQNVQENTSIREWIKYFFSVPIWLHVRKVTRNFIPRNIWIFLALRFGPNRIRNKTNCRGTTE